MLLNFLICSQLIAKIGCSIAKAGAYYKEGGISAKVGIGTRVGIGARVGISARVGIGAGVGIGARVGIRASFSKDVFRPSWMPLLALSVVYSKGVGE